MESRTLGNTGLGVSRIGLGLAALGRHGYINLGHATDLQHDYDVRSMAARARAVLDAAWNAGVRCFDAARSIDARAVTVGSKWGYTYTAGWKVDADKHEIKEHSLATLRRQAEESRTALGDYLRLYQIHSATLESGVLDNRPVLDELARM